MKYMMIWIASALLCFGQSEEPLKNLKIFPENTTRKEITKIMRNVSGDLGVRCTFCHYSPTGKFDDIEFEVDKKETKETARDMFKMTAQINDTFFKERETKISCYTCHHPPLSD